MENQIPEKMTLHPNTTYTYTFSPAEEKAKTPEQIAKATLPERALWYGLGPLHHDAKGIHRGDVFVYHAGYASWQKNASGGSPYLFYALRVGSEIARLNGLEEPTVGQQLAEARAKAASDLNAAMWREKQNASEAPAPTSIIQSNPEAQPTVRAWQDAERTTPAVNEGDPVAVLDASMPVEDKADFPPVGTRLRFTKIPFCGISSTQKIGDEIVVKEVGEDEFQAGDWSFGADWRDGLEIVEDKPQPPVMPDNVPEPGAEWIYAGKGPLEGSSRDINNDVAMWIGSSQRWDYCGNQGISTYCYALRRGSAIHRAQPWFDESQVQALKKVESYPPPESEWRELGPGDELEVITSEHQVSYVTRDDGWISPSYPPLGTKGLSFGEAKNLYNNLRARTRQPLPVASHHEPEFPNLNQAFAELGRQIFKTATGHISNDEGDEWCEEVMEEAKKHGLVRFEAYDPDKHGKMDYTPGEDFLWWWGHLPSGWGKPAVEFLNAMGQPETDPNKCGFLVINDPSVLHGDLVSKPSGIEAQICKDIADRQAVRVKKYGRTLEAANLTPAQLRQHKYEELLDAAIYAKAEILKLDGREAVEGGEG